MICSGISCPLTTLMDMHTQEILTECGEKPDLIMEVHAW